MKKSFFAALIATVAVGGAISSVNAQYIEGSPNPINCAISELATCGIAIGEVEETIVTSEPNGEGEMLGTLHDYAYIG